LISEDLERLIRLANIDDSPEVLRELWTVLGRNGFGDHEGIKDEDVHRICAVIYDPKRKLEYKNGSWVGKGKGYRYLQLQHAKKTAKKIRNSVTYRLLVPTEDLVLLEWKVGDNEKEKVLDQKIKDLESYKKYLKIQKQFKSVKTPTESV